MTILKNLPMVLMAVALIVVGGGSLAGMNTGATFTDTATATATFSSGKVDLQLQAGAAAVDCSTGTFSDTVISSTLAPVLQNPGNSATAATPVGVCLKNNGGASTSTGAISFQWSLGTVTFTDGSGGTAGNKLSDKAVLAIWKQTGASALTATCTSRLQPDGTLTAASGTEVNLLTPVVFTGTTTIAAGANTTLATNTATHKICVAAIIPNTVNDQFSANGVANTNTIQGFSLNPINFNFTATQG